jgi:hypothetical protein
MGVVEMWLNWGISREGGRGVNKHQARFQLVDWTTSNWVNGFNSQIIISSDGRLQNRLLGVSSILAGTRRHRWLLMHHLLLTVYIHSV